ncbi:MAG: T9SS type A sorting domain-containing protein [bacterium]|nr:T9SS type A sorting domain-containing protein [bacterium]
MKKQLLKGLAIVASMFALSAQAQVRFIDPVFAAVTKTSNVMYDSNAAVNILFGQVPGIQPLFSNKLMCDIYQPTGDTEVKRPLVILAHTGSYLPSIVNKQTTGNKNDSTIVQVATELALRGYVVAAINYRTGWNPTTTNQSAATEQLLKATYRGLQDVRNAVRFFKSNAAMYKIDDKKIVLGGQGTGGYIAYGVATVSSRGDIENNLKFLRGDLSPMVSVDTLGDWTGLGGYGPLNYGADAAVSSDLNMVFNFGGAMGDTAWMKSTSLPIVSLQCTKDPFAPYGTGNVIVPTTGITVIPNASGASHVIPKANKLGINNKLNSVMYLDAISERAMMVPNAENNMFGFESSFPFENAPWEWWSRVILQNTPGVPYAGAPMSAPFNGFIPANGREADSLSFLTNPNMSAAKGKAYCDTIVKYVSPRMAIQLDLAGSATLNNFNLISPANNASVVVYDSASLFLNIDWQKSSAANAQSNSTIYLFQMDIPTGDFSDPVVEVPVIDADSLVVDHATVYGLLVELGAPDNMPVPLKWRVVATNDYFGKASNSFNISLTKNAPTGIYEASLNSFVSIFPNPAKEFVNISMDNNKAPIASVAIYDIMGREISVNNNVRAHQTQINTNGFASGMYIVLVKNTDGSIASKRLTIN